MIIKAFVQSKHDFFIYIFRKLRAGYGGLLRMNPVFSEYGLKDLLPLKLDIPDEGCTRPNRSMYCFEAGESFRCKCEHFAKFRLDLIVISMKYLIVIKEIRGRVLILKE